MRYVRYIGLAHHRQISASDWRQIGISADTVVWNAFNGFAVPLDQFTDDQLRKAIEPDNSLVITGEDEKFEPVMDARRDMTPQELEAPRVDILDPNGANNASTAGSGPSTARSTDTGRGSSGHDEAE